MRLTAIFGRITRRGNQIRTENRVDPADHLKVILAVTAMPPPSRRPNQAKRVDREEDCAEYNQGDLQEFFARDVVHIDLLPVVKDHLGLLFALPII